MLRALLSTLVPLLWSLAAQSQTQAHCTFNFFIPTTPFKLQDGTPVFMQPTGINDFGTIVGVSSPGPRHGLIRWANGGVTSVKGTSSIIARNDQGTSVGADLTLQGISVNGSTITPIVIDVNNGGVFPHGINNYGTIIGNYIPPDLDSSDLQGFKRFNNGTTHTLDFPGAAEGKTQPLGINDNGFVVGAYETADGVVHGFIFHKGQLATLDYPHALFTVLVGITNEGKIIGYAGVGVYASVTLFLYKNGTFKIISVPHTVPDFGTLKSITPKRGLILGVTDFRTGKPAFIAQCQ
jgi:probable HAF family extracellular repeat protein